MWSITTPLIVRGIINGVRPLPEVCCFQGLHQILLGILYLLCALIYLDEVLVRSNDAVYFLFVLAGQAMPSSRTFL